MQDTIHVPYKESGCMCYRVVDADSTHSIVLYRGPVLPRMTACTVEQDGLCDNTLVYTVQQDSDGRHELCTVARSCKRA